MGLRAPPRLVDPRPGPRPPLHHRGSRRQCSVDPGPPSLLGQFLGNLPENACKYIDPGTPIVVRVGSSPDSASLSVEDLGTGISAADLPRIFEPFYRSESARKLGHSGVGLAVAHRIAALHAGRLTATSTPAHGSRFELRLPLADEDRASPAKHPESFIPNTT
ncbi:sensor histidine kinase [Singulisphaera sp. PoT]|uniref:sensor histidine kinase n=1 Tax=Singulisphaera sp. PoT TaxID=3411797 RepID=UPI003BF5A316